MKLIAVLLSLCFTLSAFALGAPSALEELDNYQYTLSVEWDQKDQRFYEEQTALFMERLSHLLAEEKLTSQDLLKMAEEKSLDKKSVDAMKVKLSLLGPTSSPIELAEALRSSAADFYQRGASWSPDQQTVKIGAIVAVIAVVAYAVWAVSNQYKAPETGTCLGYGDLYQCSAAPIGSSSQASCSYQNVCVRYAP